MLEKSTKIKKKNNVPTLLLAVVLFVTMLMGSVFIFAQDSYAATCGSTETFFDWGCSSDDVGVVESVLINLVNWLAVGVTVAVVGGIIYGAIMYTSSGGDQARAKKAIEIIRNAVIALLLYFIMWALLNWLVPGGLFSK